MTWDQALPVVPAICSAAIAAISLRLTYRAGQRTAAQEGSAHRAMVASHEARLATIEREVDGIGVDRQRLKTLESEVTQLRTDLKGVEGRTTAVERMSDRILEKIEGLDRIVRHDLGNIESKIDLLYGRLAPRGH